MISTNAIAVSGPTPGWVASRCASGHFSTTWSTARFSYAMVGFNRSDEAACFELLCKRAGTQVHYCAEPFSNDGRLSSTFLQLVKRTMAAEYLRELSAKVHAGQCRSAASGFKVGGRAGYGVRRLLLDSNYRPQGNSVERRAKEPHHDWLKKRLRVWLFVGILGCNSLSFGEKENVADESAYVVDHMVVHRYSCQFVPADIEAALGRRYVIGSEVAIGGQGAVFKATRTSRPDGTAAKDIVALKLYFDRRRNIRVQPEITAAENFSHPNLARLVEHGNCEVAGRHTRYGAWEFIDGQPLGVLLKNGRLLESEVLAIGRDVSSAIAEIWSRRIVHGDIKPSNIMIRNSDGYFMVGTVDNAVLIDLGAARLDQGSYSFAQAFRSKRPSFT